MAHEKNLDFLVAVLARTRQLVPNALLVIAGEGPALASLRRDVERRGLTDNVLLVGYLERRAGLLDCYRAADLFVFASARSRLPRPGCSGIRGGGRHWALWPGRTWSNAGPGPRWPDAC